MAPRPTTSSQAPSTSAAPQSPRSLPTEPSLKDLLHSSPTLFWLLIGVFSLAMTLAVVWIVVSWRRCLAHRRLLQTKEQKQITQSQSQRQPWHWFWRRAEAAVEEASPELGELEKADLGPLAPGWTPPVRSSSLAQLSRYLDVVFVPPYEPGLPLTDIDEATETESLDYAYGGLRTSGIFQGNKGEVSQDVSTPSIVVEPATSTASLSSLAYLSTTSSPLTAFIESLDAFPQFQTSFPNLPSEQRLQAPAARRSSSMAKQCLDREARSPRSSPLRPETVKGINRGKENVIEPCGLRQAGQGNMEDIHVEASRGPLKTMAVTNRF